MTTAEHLILDLDRARYRLLLTVLPDGMDYPKWKWATDNALDSIARYITTGRASMDTVLAIQSCHLCKLLKAVALSEDMSTEGMVRTMHAYLKRSRKTGA